MRWRLGLLCAALAAALVPVPEVFIERVYAAGVFPRLQPVLTGVSNLVSFALFDVLLVLGGAAWCALAIRDLMASGTWVRRVGRLVARTATWTAVLYLGFLLSWGFNYRRVSLDRRMAFDDSRITAGAARELAEESVARVNALYEAAHRGAAPAPGGVDGELADGFARAQRELGSHTRFVPGRPKRTLLDAYFLRAGVAGMTNPYFLETFVASDLLDVERPMVVAHEWSHLAGLADEGEANFAGWLACLRGAPVHQYSGWLFLYGEVMEGLSPTDARQIAAGLGDGPRRDIQAIRDRLLQHVSPMVSTAGWRVYDQYLKANEVEAGAASYAQVVRLVLGSGKALGGSSGG